MITHHSSPISHRLVHANVELATLMARLGITEQFVRAEGLWLYDEAGTEFLDMTASYGALPFGHNPADLRRIMVEFLENETPILCKGNLNAWESEAAAALRERFGADHAVFASGGAETVNLALKCARLLTGRGRLVAFRGSFHGTTGDALRVTGNARFQEAFREAVDPSVDFAPFGDAGAVEELLARHAGEVAAVVVEPVQGEGGAIPAPEGFLEALRALCDAHGALLVVDEIQTGLGRCGHLSRALSLGVRPDLLLLSKGLGGGFVPAGCCLFFGRWDTRIGLLHSSTFGGNGLAARLAVATLDRLDEALLGRVRESGEELRSGLVELARAHPELVKQGRGDGLLCGLELRRDVTARSPFLQELVREHGLLPPAVAHVRHAARVCLATTLNTHNTLRITPPLVVTSEAIRRTLAALDDFFCDFEQGRTARVVRYLLEKELPVDVPRLRAQQLEERRSRPPAPAGDRPVVAFLVHPNSASYLDHFDADFASLEGPSKERLGRNLASVIEPVRWHRFAVGSLEVHVLASPFLPSRVLELGRKTWVNEVELMVRKAGELGARLAGLGGLLSVVTRDGQDVPDVGVGITTGNSLTAFAARESIRDLLAMRHAGVRTPVALLGGYGNIGRALAELLLRDGHEVVLFGNPDNPLREQMLERTVRLLREACGAGERVRSGARLDEVSDSPILVVCATSNPGFRLEVGTLPAGSTVADLAMPPNLEAEAAAAAPGVAAFRVGRMRCPIDIPDLDMLELAGSVYGCLAETIVLGLEGMWDGYSRGPLELDRVLEIGERATALGFHSVHEPVLADSAGLVCESPGVSGTGGGRAA